jgi:hypothetical protein
VSITQGSVEETDLLTIGEVALMAQVHRNAVDKSMRLGVLRYTRLDGRRLIRKTDAAAWAKAIRFVPSCWERRAVNAN